jgi:formylglycine-generating enzyme required for sulfatase activity
MGKYEVTWSEYHAFMKLYDLFKARDQAVEVTDDNRADAFTVPTPLYDPSFTYSLGEDPRHPAVTMSQYAAKQYTKWISLSTQRFYRLPSEAEWEYACRAGRTGRFSFESDGNAAAHADGNLLAEFAWYFDNSEDACHEVGTKKPNAWDLCDMHGNVGEMVLDQYTPDGYKLLQAGHAASAIRWPTKLFGRVIRGGGWDSDPEDLRCAARTATEDWRTEDPNLPKSPWWFTDEQAQCVGFRVVRPLDAPAASERARYWDADVEYLQEDVASRVAEGRGVYGQVE